VVACSSGDDALVSLARETFDVMISDIQMPGVTGLTLLRAVRDHDLDLPVVLVTGNPGVKSAADAVEYGAFRYLIKPLHNAEFKGVILQAIAIGRAARSKREYAEEFGKKRFGVGIVPGWMRFWIALWPAFGWPINPSFVLLIS
jgi:DNA-binding NtrC family response regulator